MHGAGNGLQGTKQTFTLNAGEFITDLYLASTNCICYIKMVTSKGRTLGPVDAGCGDGATFKYTVGNGLSYLSGRSSDDVDALTLNYCTGRCTDCEYGDVITLMSRS
jgi:hypothetical protein